MKIAQWAQTLTFVCAALSVTNAQIGGIKVPVKPPKETAAPANSPAASAMGSFDNYAKSLQYCIDNKTWTDANANGYKAQLDRAKGQLDQIQQKDPAAYKVYQPKYQQYADHLQNNQDSYALSVAGSSVNSFNTRITQLESQTTAGNWANYGDLIGYAAKDLEAIRAKAPNAAPSYEAKLQKYQKIWDEEQNRSKANAAATAQAKTAADATAQANALNNRPIYGSYKEEGITGDLHQKYVGKIVFMSDNPDRAQTTEAMFKNKFGVNDYIYARTYAPHSVKNHHTYSDDKDTKPDYTDRYALYFSVGDKREKIAESENKGLNVGITTWMDYLRPKAEHTATSDNNDVARAFFDALPVGEHTVKVEVVTNCIHKEKALVPIATGEFVLVKKAGETVKYNRTFSGNIKAAMSNSTLEAQALKALQAHSDSEKWNEKFYKVKLTAAEWTINHNDAGSIVSRSMDVAGLAKTAAGTCAYYNFSLIQEYSGGGQYQSTFQFGSVGQRIEVDCE